MTTSRNYLPPLLPPPPKIETSPESSLHSLWQQEWLGKGGLPPNYNQALPTEGEAAKPPPSMLEEARYNHGYDVPVLESPAPRHTISTLQVGIEWGLLQTSTNSPRPATEFPWITPQQPEMKIEDDSDSSSWSVNNDSPEGSQSPQPGTLAGPPIAATPYRRRSAPTRVTKASSSTCRQEVAKGFHHHVVTPNPNTRTVLRASIPNHVRDEMSEAALFHRSNYENIVSGAMPGDIYPDSSFSAKLLSKRIAHKLSEKSRRNRLAAAIREIQNLLPSKAEGGAANNDNNNNNEISGDKEPSSQFQYMGPMSKVEIVELAVGYIRKLKQEKDEATRRAREAERQLYSTRNGPSSSVNNESNLHTE